MTNGIVLVKVSAAKWFVIFLFSFLKTKLNTMKVIFILARAHAGPQANLFCCEINRESSNFENWLVIKTLNNC